MEVVGYVMLNPDADGVSAAPMSHFQNKVVRVVEFAFDGGVMVINNEATAIATFDKEHIHRQFKCSVLGEVVCPPDIDMMEQMSYSSKCLTRKGGYNSTVRHLVIMASLHKQEFNDSVLWMKQ